MLGMSYSGDSGLECGNFRLQQLTKKGFEQEGYTAWTEGVLFAGCQTDGSNDKQNTV